jgi:hypothetical protein
VALQSFVGPCPLFQFLNLLHGKTPWAGDQPVASPLPRNRTAQMQNKRTQISMPEVGFKPIIPVFERAKTVHLRPSGYCDRLCNKIYIFQFIVRSVFGYGYVFNRSIRSSMFT